MKHLALVSTFGLLFLGSLNAQETAKLGYSIGGGFTSPIGSTGTRLNTGWNIRGGLGYNFSPHAGVMVDLGYDWFKINRVALDSLGVPDGGIKIFSATLNPIIHLNPRGHADVYITGGGGLYRRYVELTQPAVTVTRVYDPFYGFYPVAIGVNEVLDSYSVNKPGVNAGIGIAIGTKWHGKFFAEARYNRIFMGGGRHTDFLPVTIGFRR